MAYSDAPVESAIRMWAGDLLIDPYSAAGALTGYRDVGNATVFTQSAPAVDKQELKGRRRSNYGNVIASQITGTTQEFQVEIYDITQKNLVLNMLADETAYTQTAGNNTGTPEEITAYLGRWVDLSFRMLDPENPPVVKDAAAGTTTYVLGTDYEIDFTGGMLFALSTGSITDGEALDVESTYLGITAGVKIEGLKNLTRSAKCKLLVENQHGTATVGELVIYDGLIEPAGDTAWISEDNFSSITLKITAQDKDGQTYEYFEY